MKHKVLMKHKDLQADLCTVFVSAQICATTKTMQDLSRVGFILLIPSQVVIVITVLFWCRISKETSNKLHCALGVDFLIACLCLAGYGHSYIIYPLILLSFYIVLQQCGGSKCQIQLKTGRRRGFICGLRTVYNTKFCRRHCRASNSDVVNKTACQPTEECSLQCVVCMTNKRNVAFQPCHHLAVCAQCTKDLESCPICRTSIAVIVPIIIS